jgi:hypothetical protein
MAEAAQSWNDLRGARNGDIAFFAGPAEQYSDFHKRVSTGGSKLLG